MGIIDQVRDDFFCEFATPDVLGHIQYRLIEELRFYAENSWEYRNASFTIAVRIVNHDLDVNVIPLNDAGLVFCQFMMDEAAAKYGEMR